MKTALYIENGYTQVVITAENDFEKSALAQLEKAPSIRIEEGGFYHCKGGWVRHSGASFTDGREPSSLMIVIEKQPQP